jgi:hypothetical protein
MLDSHTNVMDKHNIAQVFIHPVMNEVYSCPLQFIYN